MGSTLVWKINISGRILGQNMKTLLDVIIYLFSILGGVVSVITIYRWLLPFKRIKWSTVEKGVKKLKEDLIHDNYMPSLIVGVGRGGSIIGALLSGCLGHVPILVIDRVYEWEDNLRKDDIREKIRLSRNLDKVLLVAGELHTGGTARTYIEYLQSIGAKEIRYLTFAKDPYPAFSPDYYFVESKKPDVRLPWMLTKEYRRESLSKC